MFNGRTAALDAVARLEYEWKLYLKVGACTNRTVAAIGSYLNEADVCLDAMTGFKSDHKDLYDRKDKVAVLIKAEYWKTREGSK